MKYNFLTYISIENIKGIVSCVFSICLCFSDFGSDQQCKREGERVKWSKWFPLVVGMAVDFCAGMWESPVRPANPYRSGCNGHILFSRCLYHNHYFLLLTIKYIPIIFKLLHFVHTKNYGTTFCLRLIIIFHNKMFLYTKKL